MKNQYIGDINDYVKYGLILSIAEIFSKKILFVWMLTKDDESLYGGQTTYLKSEKYRGYNPGLFDVLKDIVKSNIRNNTEITAIEENELFKKYKFEFIHDIIEDNKKSREDYFKRVYESVEKNDIIFFDPDNGLEVKSHKKGNKNSSKYVYWDEVKEVYRRKKNLLIYQHFPHVPKEEYLKKRVKECRAELNINNEAEIISIKTKNVVFFFIVQNDINLIEKLKDELKKWRKEMDIVIHTKKKASNSTL